MNQKEKKVKLLAIAARIPELSGLTSEQKYKSLERLITEWFTSGKGSGSYDAQFAKVLNLANEKFEGGNVADLQQCLVQKTSPTAKETFLTSMRKDKDGILHGVGYQK